MPNVTSAFERLIREFGEKGAEREARAVGKKLTEETAEEILQKAHARDSAFSKALAKEEPRPLNPLDDEPSPEEIQKFDSFLSSPGKAPPAQPLRESTRPQESPQQLFSSLDDALAQGTPTGTFVKGAGEEVPAEASAKTATGEELDAFANKLKAEQEARKGSLLSRNKGKAALGAAGLGAGGYMLSDDGTQDEELAAKNPPDSPPIGGSGGYQGPGSAPIVPMPMGGGNWRQAPLKKPEDVSTLLSKYKEELEGLKGPAKKTLDKKLGELDSLAATLKDEYKNKKSRIEWAEVAETVGHALAQLGAGLQGMKTGVDLSGVRFNKTDWESKSKNALDALREEMQGLQAQRDSATKEFDTEAKQAEHLADAGLRAGLSDREAVQGENWKRGRSNQDNDFRIADREDRQAHELEALGAREDAKVASRPDKVAEKRNSALARATAELSTLKDLKSSERPKAVRQLVSTFYRDAGVAPPNSEELEKAVEKINDPGFWNDPDPSALAEMLKQAAGGSTGGADALVSIQKAGTGQVFQVTPDKAQKLLQLNAGWQRVGH